MNLIRYAGAVLLITIAESCGGSAAPETAATPASSAPSAMSAPASARPQGRDPNVISKAELADPTLAGRDAQYIIQQLRPAFLRPRGRTNKGGTDATYGLIKISQDFGPLQVVEELTNMEIKNVIEIRYFNPEEAQQRFGISANGGPVILLLTTKS